MAAISRSRRAASGIALIVAGAALLLSVLLPYAGVSLPWLVPVAYLAIAVGLVILALGGVNNTIAKIALFAGALGWLVLALANFGVGLPGGVATVGAFLAGIGTLVGAIVLYAGREIIQISGLLFVITAALGLLLILPALGIGALSGLALFWAVAFGIGLVLTGLYFRRTERKRSR